MFILSPPRGCNPHKSRVLGCPDLPHWFHLHSELGLARPTPPPTPRAAVTGGKPPPRPGPGRGRLSRVLVLPSSGARSPSHPAFSRPFHHLFNWPPPITTRAHLGGTTEVERTGSCLQGSPHLNEPHLDK